MEDVLNLFPEVKPGLSAKTKVGIACLVGLIGVCVMAIAFYGLGPMLAQPMSQQMASQSPDVSDVLGLNKQPSTASVPLSQSQLQQLIGSIADQVRLPQDNTAQAFRITNINQLKQDSFFADAANGDVYIIFQPSKAVLLYSVSQKKIVQEGQLQ